MAMRKPSNLHVCSYQHMHVNTRKKYVYKICVTAVNTFSSEWVMQSSALTFTKRLIKRPTV